MSSYLFHVLKSDEQNIGLMTSVPEFFDMRPIRSVAGFANIVDKFVYKVVNCFFVCFGEYLVMVKGHTHVLWISGYVNNFRGLFTSLNLFREKIMGKMSFDVSRGLHMMHDFH